jgi:hypothetical protein
MFNRWLILLISAFVVTGFMGCGIESVEPNITLAPPMAMTLSNVATNCILVTFHGFNQETYFDGYYIYVTDSDSSAQQGNGYIVPPPEGITFTNNPTMRVVPVTKEQVYTYTVSYFTNGPSGPVGFNYNAVRYYFYAKAYSSQYVKWSSPCAYTNIQFEPKP